MSLDSAITASCLILAWLSFAIFAYATLKQLKAKETATEVAKTAINAQPKTEGFAIGDISKILENAAKFIDSLTKAGPGLAALVASILFLTIANFGVSAIGKTVAAQEKSTATGADKPAMAKKQ